MQEHYTNKIHQKEDEFQTVINPDEYPFWIPQYGITHKDTSYHEIRMSSDVSCIEYIISGSGTIISDNQSFIVNKGDTYMLVEGSNVNYYSNPDDPFEKIWINIKGELAKKIIEVYNLQSTMLFRNTNTYNMIKEIHNVCQSETNPQVIQDKVSAMFLNLIQFLYRNQKKINLKSDTIDMFRYYIDCHITENTKLSTVAQLSNINLDHAIRVFKKKYGLTPHQYIIESKIKIAKSMLKATNKPISEIASLLEFNDPHNFSALFQKHVGVRPSVFRKMDIITE